MLPQKPKNRGQRKTHKLGFHMAETPEQLKTILSNTETAIRYILAHYPEARNNDKLLMLLYWELVDKIKIPKEFQQAFLHRATHPETIRRTRQKIQSQHEYLPSEDVLKKRRRLQDMYREVTKDWKQQTLL
jgi:hypothetical protein